MRISYLEQILFEICQRLHHGRVKFRSNYHNEIKLFNDAISMAGGTRVLRGKLTFLRFNKDGTIEKKITMIKMQKEDHS